MEVKFGVLATSTSNSAKSNLPHGAVSARTHWGEVLVSLRDFPYSLIDFLAIELGPLFMRHSRRSKLPTSDLTFCSGAAAAAAATPRRASLRKTLPLLTNGEKQTKLSSQAVNSKRNRALRVEGLVPLCYVVRKLSRMHGVVFFFFFKPAELLVLLPTFFQTAPEISPCLQLPKRREVSRDSSGRPTETESRAAFTGGARMNAQTVCITFCLGPVFEVKVSFRFCSDV